MTHDEVLARTRAYVFKTFLYMRPGFSLGDGDRLFAKGVIDSMGVVELIDFLQSEFGITVADDEITEKNLGALSDIARFVVGKRAAGAAA